ncbi:hypothetical protein [uncultured Roseobacter sp.]|uniref:hypothetical protein n=1 Tax=uncultured Roseobacter sp. TaxID=114847 RepID=UPI00262621A6|nr:hypothetical protein [uncultured Roseobacter sp.]
MSRHLSFWIGFFAAALVIVPVAVGAWGVTQGFARDWAATFFIVICTIVGLLVIGLLFRGVILRRLTGRAEATVEDISSTLISGVSAAVAQDRATAEREADKLARVVLGWYAWSNFYRWVIGTALALLLAFASFTGTVLLFEQIAKLEDQTRVMQAQQELMDAQTRFMESQTLRLQEQTEAAAMQNEIMTLNLVNQLRDQMLASIESRPLGEWLRSFGAAGVDDPVVSQITSREACGLGFNQDHILYSHPSTATLGAIVNLTTSEALGARVIEALRLLTQDRHGGVALGALLILEEIGHPYVEAEVHLRSVMIAEPVFLRDASYKLVFRASYVASLFCADCHVHIGTSVFFKRAPHSMSGFGNILVRQDARDPLNGITVLHRSDDLPQDWDGMRLSKSAYFPEDYTAWLTQHEAGPMCEEMAGLARLNPLLVPMAPGVSSARRAEDR